MYSHLSHSQAIDNRHLGLSHDFELLSGSKAARYLLEICCINRTMTLNGSHKGKRKYTCKYTFFN